MNTVPRLLCIALLALSGAAWADVSRDQAAAIALQANSGRVLSVDRTEAEGRPVWRVKLVTANGDVRIVLVDVATGKPV